jgi:hypothetical protein
MCHGIKIDDGKFKAFVRYMVKVAEEKRCVPYYELENVFGLNHKYVGGYAGTLGDFCEDQEWPLLNALIISTTECVPSEGFDQYMEGTDMDWGEHVQDCWKTFHVTSTRAKQVKNFSRLDSRVTDFFAA